MADIVLAEFAGRAWVIKGETYIDELLVDRLPSHISIELLACESNLALQALIEGAPDENGVVTMPCMIHPAIVARIRARLGGRCACFQEWSARLDGFALNVIAESAAAAGVDGQLVLTAHLAPDGPRPLADLAALRCSVIEAELVRHGIAAARIRRATAELGAAPDPAEAAQRIDIALLVA